MFCEIVVSLSSSKRGKLMGPPGVLMCDKLTKDLMCVLEFCLSCNRLMLREAKETLDAKVLRYLWIG